MAEHQSKQGVDTVQGVSCDDIDSRGVEEYRWTARATGVVPDGCDIPGMDLVKLLELTRAERWQS